jgi:hypothetical protein
MNSFKLLKKYKNYRYFWCSNFMSNLAVWIQIVASGIYMSELSSSPLQIALVQVMAALPIFLFSVPLGGYMLGKVLLYLPIQRLFEIEGVILIAMGTFLFLKTPKSISEDLVVK